MKKYIFASLVMLAAGAMAQTPTTLSINLKSGEKVAYTLSDIDNITFTEGEGDDPQPEVKNVKFSVPASFESSFVQKVMNGSTQVAEIAQEYIKSINKQVVVVYPCGEDGKADLTKGVTSTGASVVWDLSANTATVGDEGDEVATFYIVDGELLTSYDGQAIDASVQPDLLVDVRGSESNTYRLCKIGTFYLTADNLRATRYADGSAIPGISETETDAWKANTTGAYLAYGDAQWVKYAGYLYSGYVIFNEAGIAPEGWAVPTQAEYSKIRTAGNLLSVNFKDSAELTWATGGEGNNMTGFSGIATGYYSTATDLTGMNTEAFFWSSTKYYDALARADVIDYFRLTATGKNSVVSTTITGGHSQPFAHSIRLIRK